MRSLDLAGTMRLVWVATSGGRSRVARVEPTPGRVEVAHRLSRRLGQTSETGHADGGGVDDDVDVVRLLDRADLAGGTGQQGGGRRHLETPAGDQDLGGTGPPEGEGHGPGRPAGSEQKAAPAGRAPTPRRT